MQDIIQTIAECHADAFGSTPDECVGSTVRDILKALDQAGGFVVYWATYPDDVLDTVIGWEHMSATTMQRYAAWFASHGVVGQA